MEVPFSAVIWQPVVCESASETEAPNAFSTASFSSARQTSLVSSPPEGDSDPGGRADAESPGDGDSALVGPPPPGRTASSARVPRPVIVLPQPAENVAASST